MVFCQSLRLLVISCELLLELPASLSITINVFFLRDVMVSNAHQETEPEAKRIFDIGYLAAVAGFLLLSLAMPVVQFTLNGIRTIDFCLGQEENIDDLLKISTAAIVLIFTFTVLVSIRTNKNLRKLQDQHLKNLPANNALTFVDTLILCFLSYSNFFVQRFLISVYNFDFLAFEALAFWVNFSEFFMCNIIISFVFPIYIILKTRRYLPRLWDDNSPLILQNNDFYAVRLSQISPCQSAFAESSL